MPSSQSSSLTLPALLSWYRDLTRDSLSVGDNIGLIHIYHSAALDGCSLTLSESLALLEYGATTDSKPAAHHWMLVDYQQAQQQMLAWAAEREPLNRARLQAIGTALMRRTGGPMHTILGSYDSKQGEFRLASPMTAHRKLVDAQKLPAAVDKLLRQLNTDVAAPKTMRQLYDLSFKVHYDLLCLQPFGEGNGRVARLLMNYVQHYHKLPISLVHATDRQAYTKALDQSQSQSFARPILDFMYAQLITYLQMECERLSQYPS
ncbi:hypothetical protein GCM10028818_57400 [Spirosoma horti]